MRCHIRPLVDRVLPCGSVLLFAAVALAICPRPANADDIQDPKRPLKWE